MQGSPHTDHHEELQGDTPAEPQQGEGADGDSSHGLASPRELQAQGDSHVQVHAGVVLQQLHKHCPAPAEGQQQLRGWDSTSSGATGGWDVDPVPCAIPAAPLRSQGTAGHSLWPGHTHMLSIHVCCCRNSS